MKHLTGNVESMGNITEIHKDYQALAKEKIAVELKSFTGGQKEKAVSEFVASTLTHFCEQNTSFAEVVYKTRRTLSDCCAKIMKGCGTHISDIDVYRGAVKSYFPNSDIRCIMEIEITGEAPSEEEMAKLPEKPKPKSTPKKAGKPKDKPSPVPVPAPAPKEKPKPEVIQLSLF